MSLLVIWGLAILASFLFGRTICRRDETTDEMGQEWVARMYAEDHAVFSPGTVPKNRDED